jgi:hypothetical protein
MFQTIQYHLPTVSVVLLQGDGQGAFTSGRVIDADMDTDDDEMDGDIVDAGEVASGDII